MLHRSSSILWQILKNRIEITQSLVESQTHVSFQGLERIKYRSNFKKSNRKNFRSSE